MSLTKIKAPELGRAAHKTMKSPNKLIEDSLVAQREQTILHQKMLVENHNDEEQTITLLMDDCFSFSVGRQNITNTKKPSPQRAWDVNKTKAMSKTFNCK